MSYSEEEVRALVARQMELVSAKEGELLRDKHGKLPEFWPGYNTAYDQMMGLRVHIEPDQSAEHLFEQRSPNMSQKELDYLLANFKQTTLPIFTDVENTISRGMSKGNWSLDFDEAAKVFEEYATKGLMEWKSVENFFTYAYLRPKMADAMGLVVTLPDELSVIEVGEEVMLDPSALVKPVPAYYECSRVWGFEYDKWYLLRLDKNSPVQYGNRTRNTGIWCIFVDDTTVWNVMQVGREGDMEFEITAVYDHNCGEPPCIHNRGVLSVIGGKPVWQSPYLAAKDTLDLALMDTNMLQASKNKLMYPHMVVVGSTCTYVDPSTNACCDKGNLTWTDEENELKITSCPNCFGGKVKSFSPLGELVVSPPNLQTGESNSGQGITADNALRFVGPETASGEFMRKEINYYEQKARKILHVDAEAPMAGGEAKTATEAGLDAKARDAFVKLTVDQTFTAMEFTLTCIAKQQGFGDNAFTLNKPTTYDLRSADDYLRDAQQAKEQGMPPSVIDDLVSQWITVKYEGDERAQAMFQALAKADRFHIMPWEQFVIQQAANRVQPWEAMLHESGKYLYQELMDEDNSFEGLTTREQATKLIEKAKALTAPAKVVPITSKMEVVERTPDEEVANG